VSSSKTTIKNSSKMKRIFVMLAFVVGTVNANAQENTAVQTANETATVVATEAVGDAATPPPAGTVATMPSTGDYYQGF
jgi:hypothetical protein